MSNLAHLIEQYRELHLDKRSYGTTGDNKAPALLPVVVGLAPTSMLDYGCGKSNLVDLLNPGKTIKTYKYDPAIDKLTKMPVKEVDLVLCTDVLEHIPEEHLGSILEDVRGLSDTAIFAVSLREAGHILPDGSNCHPTVKPKDWWIKKIEEHYGSVETLYDAPPKGTALTTVLLAKDKRGDALDRIAEFRMTMPLRQGIEHRLGVELYNLILEENMKVVVETGVCHGFSSWYFLEALKKTGGKLYSIEPVPQDIIVVPTELKKNWTIIQEKSPAALIKLFGRIGEVDMFWHDSLHDFASQRGEYAIASRFCRFMGSHDVYKTGAWIDFINVYGWEEIIGKWGSKHAVAVKPE